MRRVFADLHLTADSHDLAQIKRLTRKAAELGYRLIALTMKPDIEREESDRIEELCREAGLDCASRIDLKPKTEDELTNNLRKYRRRFDIIAVCCVAKAVARQAAKDRRVDLLSFPSLTTDNRMFNAAEARLASRSLASLELDMKPFYTSEGSARSKLLSIFRRQTAAAQAFKVPLVISSGTADEMLLRKPMEIAALASLFDIKKNVALDAISRNPMNIIKRNRQKLKRSFILPGVRVIRKGKNC